MELDPSVKSLLLDVHQFIRNLDDVSLRYEVRKSAISIMERICNMSILPSINTERPESIADEDIYDEVGVTSDSADAEVGASVQRAGSVSSGKASGLSLAAPSRSASLRSWVWASDEPTIAEQPVKALDNWVIQGELDKKRPDTEGFKKLLSTYQKRYCVVSQGNFYYYESHSSKKQSGAFSLAEYEARPAYSLFPKDPKKQECSFELVSPAKRSYRFLARSFQDMVDWVHAVAQVSKVPHPDTIPHPSTLSQGSKSSSVKDADSLHTGSEADDKMSDSDSLSSKGAYPKHTFQPLPATPQGNQMEEETYDDVQADQSTAEEEQYNDAQITPVKTKRELPPPPEEESYDDVSPTAKAVPTPHKRAPLPETPAEDEETYDDVKPDTSMPAHKMAQLPVPPIDLQEEETYDDGAAVVPPQTPHKSAPLPAAPTITDEPEETYDDVAAAPALPNRPKNLSAKLPKRSLPTPPQEKRIIHVSDKDYSNMFYGMWDCEAAQPHELSFKAGDILHVVEKKHEQDGWLTAILRGKIGLVPKEFLTLAYGKT